MIEEFIEFPVIFLNNLNIFERRKLKKWFKIFIWVPTLLAIGGHIIPTPLPSSYGPTSTYFHVY